MIHLLHLSAECAPMVAPSTMAAIVRVESGGNPLAMWNDSTRSMVVPGNRAQAMRYLRQAMDAGQQVDVGLAQVDTENFAAYGLTLANVFDACANLRAGAEILSADYRKAKAVYGAGQLALYHAFEAYNSGRLRGDALYANRILNADGVSVPANFVVTNGVHGAGTAPTAASYPQFRWRSAPDPQVRWTVLP
ncbi:lytic transglycosylase domain-containing protein [Acidithiobacillus sp.]|uniref:lytic transglycosylase domain-containing protein n=1 Tax=Acidithiobacillus sp. TaxID=1872118 RepID=UPI003CFFADAB